MLSALSFYYATASSIKAKRKLRNILYRIINPAHWYKETSYNTFHSDMVEDMLDEECLVVWAKDGYTVTLINSDKVVRLWVENYPCAYGTLYPSSSGEGLGAYTAMRLKNYLLNYRSKFPERKVVYF
jgi:hypothetical protein